MYFTTPCHLSVRSNQWKWVESAACRDMKCPAWANKKRHQNTREKINARCKEILMSQQTWEFAASQTSLFKGQVDSQSIAFPHSKQG